MFVFFSVSVIFILSATILFLTRSWWKPLAPPIPYITAPGTIPEPLYRVSEWMSDTISSYRYSRLPTNFQEDAEAGFHSTNFDLAQNIETGDSRQGLDEDAKRQVYKIMKSRKVNFDEARRIHTENMFGKAGISADGRPLDSKAVMFS